VTVKDKHKITTSEVKHARRITNYSLPGTKAMKAVNTVLGRENDVPYQR